MAKKVYIGESNKARKINKLYIGVENKARKVKKGYIGVNGVAKLFWTSERTLSRKGTATALSAARYNLSGASVGNYALFAGGSSNSNVVDAYSNTLTKSTPTTLSAGRQYMAGASVGNYALFAGGGGGNFFSACSSVVEAYNTSLTRSLPTELNEKSMNLAGASVGNYALFAGGNSDSTMSNAITDVVNAYNTSLTRSTPTALSSSRQKLSGASVGNYALFAGGTQGNRVGSSSISATVDAYNESLTRSSATNLSVERENMGATSVGNYALFAGGSYPPDDPSANTVVSDVVNAYNTSLTRSTTTSLSVSRHSLGAASLGDYALFAGGYYIEPGWGAVSKESEDTVDAYNESLTRTIPTKLNTTRYSLAGTSVGNYILFAGGLNTPPADSNPAQSSGNTPSAIVDVYTAQ